MCCQDRIYRWKYHFCIFPPTFSFHFGNLSCHVRENIPDLYTLLFSLSHSRNSWLVPYYFPCHIREIIPDLYLVIFPVTFEKPSLTCTLFFSPSHSRNHPWLVPYNFPCHIREIIPDLYPIIFYTSNFSFWHAVVSNLLKWWNWKVILGTYISWVLEK